MTAADTVAAGEAEVEGRYRPLPAALRLGTWGVAIAWSTFQLWTAFFGPHPALEQRAIHLGAAFLLIFLLVPALRRRASALILAVDLVLGAAGAAACAYLAWNHYDIVTQSGSHTDAQLWLAGLAVVLVLEATRRTLGWALPVTALVALLYAYFGAWAPEIVAHQGFSLRRIAAFQFLTTEGIFGIILGTSANFIFVFILMAVFLQRLGGAQLFIDASFSMLGWMRGGSAKIGVVASSLFGMISGSTVANAGTIGSVTIPMMKRSGFSPVFAAAVESVASCGGQIMPPVMGAGAFLMAEFLDIPYARVAFAALLPALLYYAALFVMVDLEAHRRGHEGLPRAALPRLGAVLRRQGYLALPLAVLVVLLGVYDYSAALAGFWSVVASTVLVIARHWRLGWLRRVLEILRDGAVAATEIAIVSACIGIVVGVVMMTGLGLKLSQILISISGGHLFALLVFTMIASLVLGTALPTTPTYLILAVLVAPALIEMGVPPLPAHLFIFYYGVLADITPPTALCVYVAASIAGAPFFRTTFVAVVLSFAGFLLPFMFVFHPELVLLGTASAVVWRVVTALVSIIGFAAAIMGFLRRGVGAWWRVGLAAGALLTASGRTVPELIGLGIVLAGVVMHGTRRATALVDRGAAMSVATRAP